ncbi:phospho-N-acetylmuramoyl-pentapeptide-transferase [Candidatus Dependentiae bacterium]|nr:MAG: phospho-N-acetylmuramoyl-pentapeptide-transferase [Candidatus Dependentiae bacterium]
MIYHIAYALKPYLAALNLVHYVSFRAIAALLSALIFSLLFGNWFITKFRILFASKTRPWVPERHKIKDNLPTMGGLFIITTVILTSLLWSDLSKPIVWIFLLSLISFGSIGFWDDWCKIHYNRGMPASHKFILQWLMALIITGLWIYVGNASTVLSFPFFKNLNPNLGLFFIPWAMFIMVGSCNAVNLTDGLDGLAIGSLMPNFATFSLICYLAGNAKFAHYLHIPFSGSAEITILGATLVGVSLGFLWYNTYPAQIFMGDVGSLALGGGLAFMALTSKQELLLLLSGGLFVLETLSVIIQICSHKFLGYRIFKMAPLHHHFELLGWQESKITVRFAIISLILCLLALISLKIR